MPRELLRVEAALAHLLDGEWPVAKLCISRFVDGAEAPFADLTEDAIAPFEDVLLDEQACEGVAGEAMEGASTGGAEHRLCPVGRATSIAKEGRGKCHAFLFLSLERIFVLVFVG